MKTIWRTLAILFFLFNLTSFAWAEKVVGSDGVSLEALEGWDSQGAQKGAALVLTAPSPLSEGFHPNVNVMIQNAEGMTDDEYYRLTKEQAVKVRGQVSDYDDFTFDNGRKGKTMILTFGPEGSQLKTLSVWRIAGERLYLVSCTITGPDFPTRKPIFVQMAKTLRI